MRNLITLFDLSTEEIERIFAVTEDLKTKFERGLREPLLPGRVMALLFEKQSLRTRVSFEAAITHLGGGSMFLGQDVGWGKREAMADFGQVLSQYVDVIVCRSYSHDKVLTMAQHSSCSVVNGLTDYCHPCQALADLYTVRETLGFEGIRVAYVGDANNVARSLAVACAKLGIEIAVATPAAHRFDAPFLQRLAQDVPGARLIETVDPREAVRGAQVVYTDVWTSMGQEAEEADRKQAFADYQVNARLMSVADPEAIFLHCLPARRGLEVTDDVIDGPQSGVIRQAANRMHAQKGLLAWLLTH